MEKYNATLKLTSIIDDSQDDKIEFIADCGFYFKNDTYFIMYEEKKEMGMNDCSVTIKVKDDNVSIMRKGEFSSKMVYKNGDVSEVMYHTPYGEISMYITTKSVKNALSVMGGKMELLYDMEIEGEKSNHYLLLEVSLNKNEGE